MPAAPRPLRILVTDGNSRAALAITRSLGSRGHDIMVGGKRAVTLAARSRHCRHGFAYPDPSGNKDAFVDHLAETVRRHRVDLLIPVTDVCVLPVSEARERFLPHVRLVLPPHDSLRLAADKHRLLELAREIGVPRPASWLVETPADILPALYRIGYPVVIKPSRSRVPSGRGWLSTRVDYAECPEDLEEKLCKLPAAAYPIVLQERIVGPGIGQFYCYDQGRCVAAFAHRRLREKPPSGGVSVLRESVPLDPEADRCSRLLLERLNWHGVAMVEFKRDQRDGRPRLMEINGRFWGSLQLAIDAGVDFPWLLTRIALGELAEDDAFPDYRNGVRSRWLCGDMDLMLMYLFKSRRQLQLPADAPPRWRTLLDILKPFGRDMHYEVLRRSDFRPWLHEFRGWLQRIC
ncbi:MAG TPA: ATP-dependent carboxylate-amine ligase [Gammaproteobacteria bacterium]|nr:ATP-dependent carboxylate-amine ligase [Gammaproteobacteria bacterium]